MYNPENFIAPKKSRVQVDNDWLSSHGYRQIFIDGTLVLKAAPVGNTVHGFVPCSVEPDLVAEPGESLHRFVQRVHPEWVDDWASFK